MATCIICLVNLSISVIFIGFIVRLETRYEQQIIHGYYDCLQDSLDGSTLEKVYGVFQGVSLLTVLVFLITADSKLNKCLNEHVKDQSMLEQKRYMQKQFNFYTVLLVILALFHFAQS